MHLRDKILYHQIHPLKLGTDATASVISFGFSGNIGFYLL
jgi:hypothetical protein